MPGPAWLVSGATVTDGYWTNQACPLRYACRCSVLSGRALLLCPVRENVMARRKSLVAQMYAAHQKAKLERERAEERARKEFAAEERRIAARLEKEAAQQRRDEERAAQARVKEEQQAERAAQLAAAQDERLAAAQVREQRRQQAEADRREQRRAVEERRLAVQRRIAEAEFRTDAVQKQVAALDQLLQDRNRILAAQSRRVEEAFNTQGSAEFVAACSRRWQPRSTRTPRVPGAPR